MYLKIFVLSIVLLVVSSCFNLRGNAIEELSNRSWKGEEMLFSDSVSIRLEISDTLVILKEWQDDYKLLRENSGMNSYKSIMPTISLIVYNSCSQEILVPYEGLDVRFNSTMCDGAEICIYLAKNEASNFSPIISTGNNLDYFTLTNVFPYGQKKLPMNFGFMNEIHKSYQDTGLYCVYSIYRNNIDVDTTNFVWRGKIYSDTLWFRVVL